MPFPLIEFSCSISGFFPPKYLIFFLYFLIFTKNKLSCHQGMICMHLLDSEQSHADPKHKCLCYCSCLLILCLLFGMYMYFYYRNICILYQNEILPPTYLCLVQFFQFIQIPLQLSTIWIRKQAHRSLKREVKMFHFLS